MIYDFSDLQQTDENRWQARYHGNYGTYTVKIEFDANGRCFRKILRSFCGKIYRKDLNNVAMLLIFMQKK